MQPGLLRIEQRKTLPQCKLLTKASIVLYNYYHAVV